MVGVAINIVAGVLIFLGIAGVLIPVIPGVLLSWLGVLLWAIFGGGTASTRWIFFVIVTMFALIGVVAKYAWPHARLRRAGMPTSSILAGVVLGIVGFFVIPFVGLPLGFVLGVYLAEGVRNADFAGQTWKSVASATFAVALALMIELFVAMTIAVTWVIGLLVA
jgi:uncharacterized protein